MKNLPRVVTTGKEIYYLGKTQGNLQTDRIEVKGCPRTYVDHLIGYHRNLDTVKALCESLAKIEESAMPFTPGSSMGTKAFWRNASAYAKNLKEG